MSPVALISGLRAEALRWRPMNSVLGRQASSCPTAPAGLPPPPLGRRQPGAPRDRRSCRRAARRAPEPEPPRSGSATDGSPRVGGSAHRAPPPDCRLRDSHHGKERRLPDRPGRFLLRAIEPGGRRRRPHGRANRMARRNLSAEGRVPPQPAYGEEASRASTDKHEDLRIMRSSRPGWAAKPVRRFGVWEGLGSRRGDARGYEESARRERRGLPAPIPRAASGTRDGRRDAGRENGGLAEGAGRLIVDGVGSD